MASLQDFLKKIRETPSAVMQALRDLPASPQRDSLLFLAEIQIKNLVLEPELVAVLKQLDTDPKPKCTWTSFKGWVDDALCDMNVDENTPIDYIDVRNLKDGDTLEIDNGPEGIRITHK